MEGKDGVCGLEDGTGVSNAPLPSPEKEGEEEVAVECSI